jgi:hypothetical protein
MKMATVQIQVPAVLVSELRRMGCRPEVLLGEFCRLGFQLSVAVEEVLLAGGTLAEGESERLGCLITAMVQSLARGMGVPASRGQPGQRRRPAELLATPEPNPDPPG